MIIFRPTKLKTSVLMEIPMIYKKCPLLVKRFQISIEKDHFIRLYLEDNYFDLKLRWEKGIKNIDIKICYTLCIFINFLFSRFNHFVWNQFCLVYASNERKVLTAALNEETFRYEINFKHMSCQPSTLKNGTENIVIGSKEIARNSFIGDLGDINIWTFALEEAL